MSDNLVNFKWSGIDKRGRRLKGSIQAVDQKTAEVELRGREIQIINIKQVKKTTLFGRGSIKMRDVVLFTRYLTTMLSAGLPIIQALDIISKDPTNELLRSVVTSI